ncbi:hypothetical protein P3L10_031345 [Capsicum annuum]
MSGIAMATCDNVGAFLEDLAKEILLNFYVKSLLRFKYVCNRGSQVHYRTLECSKKKPPQFLIYDYGAHDDAPHVTVISHNGIPSPSQGDNSQRFGSITDLLGSVDGLFFLEREIDRGILVRHLPAATIELQPFDLYGRHFGFGLDTMTKDYKVVYHYLRDKYAADPTWKIISFDFGKEVFVEIKGPPDDYYIDVWSANLIFLDDTVAIMNFLEGRVIDIWVMIRPGVWNKLVTFNLFDSIKTCYESSLILSDDSPILSYNVRTKKTRLLEFFHPDLSSSAPNHAGCGIYYYKESLVSIKRQGNGELELGGCLTKMVTRY